MDTSINFTSFAPETIHPQEQSPLFSTLPGEIRDKILSYALMQHEDRSRTYDVSTVWSRPDFRAPRRIDVAVLRTCKRVYQESWYRPWAAAQHTVFLTSADRAPNKHVTTTESIGQAVGLIHAVHGDVEAAGVKVYSQLWAVQGGEQLPELLQIPHFAPREVCLTIRHTDWWWWESDTPLYIEGAWVARTVFPASVEVFRMELESLERKKDQVDAVAQVMSSKWTFKRADGAKLVGLQGAMRVTRWTGSSTWGDLRWIRDETKPGELDYYIKTVTWKPLSASEGKDPEATWCDVHANGQRMAHQTYAYLNMPSVRAFGLNVDGVEAGEALKMFIDASAQQDGSDAPRRRGLR